MNWCHRVHCWSRFHRAEVRLFRRHRWMPGELAAAFFMKQHSWNVDHLCVRGCHATDSGLCQAEAEHGQQALNWAAVHLTECSCLHRSEAPCRRKTLVKHWPQLVRCQVTLRQKQTLLCGLKTYSTSWTVISPPQFGACFLVKGYLKTFKAQWIGFS